MSQAYPIEIAASEAAALVGAAEAPVELLDVREPWEVEICSLAGARHIPMAEMPTRYGELPRDRAVIVFCHHGVRSLQVTLWLREQGMENAINLGGGIDAWARDVDPALPTY